MLKYILKINKLLNINRILIESFTKETVFRYNNKLIKNPSIILLNKIKIEEIESEMEIFEEIESKNLNLI